MSKFELHLGDCIDVLRTLPDNSVDSIVTDPPYGLAFRGQRWDYDVPSVEIWAECLRVLRPGGHLLAFAGTRTHHRMCTRIEDAGFEIRDMIAWVYGTGFPKSHNGPWGGTALKPAFEPITLARKPLTETLARNWREHGTGALNIDGCRVGDGSDRSSGGAPIKNPAGSQSIGGGWANNRSRATGGRWPANLIHDGCNEVVAGFPTTGPSSGADRGASDNGVSAARFFYCAKSSARDRGEGNRHPTVKPTDLMRYLCRLVTPPGGLILDPFMGSGSTGRSALLEGYRFIGIERDDAYFAIAKTRVAAEADLLGEPA
ncbi:DNA-methyltransferase [Azotobacter vinelandii]|uniref:DNA-methyltransferase n=1 Tax=Azotobacter vinelandii TaxID=354 RepID=UPI000916E796|nr:site-specific DNA-methyltransferase [Azotobacter vinelandii]SFY33844.1 site-specific DNA-methyltransferase (adenine-specific) [Azotobacter vinelandii]